MLALRLELHGQRRDPDVEEQEDQRGEDVEGQPDEERREGFELQRRVGGRDCGPGEREEHEVERCGPGGEHGDRKEGGKGRGEGGEQGGEGHFFG
jgi:hypothetical protein